MPNQIDRPRFSSKVERLKMGLFLTLHKGTSLGGVSGGGSKREDGMRISNSAWSTTATEGSTWSPQVTGHSTMGSKTGRPSLQTAQGGVQANSSTSQQSEYSFGFYLILLVEFSFHSIFMMSTTAYLIFFTKYKNGFFKNSVLLFDLLFFFCFI